MISNNKDFSISVVVPFYNRSGFLKRLLDSVVQQIVAVNKVYIIDNGSSVEETLSAWEIITQHNLYDKCVFTSSIGKGNANYARNLGYELAETKYVAFLDSDDWWEKEHLASSLSYLQKSNKVAVYSGAIIHNDSGYKIMKSIDVNVFDNPFSLIMSRHGYLAQTSSYVVDKSKLGFKVIWNENLKRHQDFDYFASIFYYSEGWSYCPKINVNIDRKLGGTEKINLDFDSLIRFYRIWHEKIPNEIKKSYLLYMLNFAYRYGNTPKIIDFYENEIKSNNYFNSLKYRVTSNRLYILTYFNVVNALDKFRMKAILKDWLKK